MSNIIPLQSSSPPPLNGDEFNCFDDEDEDDEFGNFAMASPSFEELALPDSSPVSSRNKFIPINLPSKGNVLGKNSIGLNNLDAVDDSSDSPPNEDISQHSSKLDSSLSKQNGNSVYQNGENLHDNYYQPNLCPISEPRTLNSKEPINTFQNDSVAHFNDDGDNSLSNNVSFYSHCDITESDETTFNATFPEVEDIDLNTIDPASNSDRSDAIEVPPHSEEFNTPGQPTLKNSMISTELHNPDNYIRKEEHLSEEGIAEAEVDSSLEGHCEDKEDKTNTEVNVDFDCSFEASFECQFQQHTTEESSENDSGWAFQGASEQIPPISQLDTKEEEEDFGDFADFEAAPPVKQLELEEDDEFDNDFADFESIPISSLTPTTDLSPDQIYDPLKKNSENILKGVIENIFPCLSETSDVVFQPLLETRSKLLLEKLQDLDNTPALSLAWPLSQTFQQLIKALNIDGNFVNPSIPLFAVGLGLLEPIPIDAQDDNSPAIPEAHFDWSQSGLVNPLEESSSAMLNLDFFDKELSKLEEESGQLDSEEEKFKVPSLLTNLLISPPAPVSAIELSDEAKTILKQLPDLKFMQASVLMFPVLEAS